MVKGKNTKQAESELANLKARQDGLRDVVSKLESELLLRRSELYQSETNDLADELNAEIAKVKGEMHQAGQSLVEIAANAEKWKESLSKIRDQAHAPELGTFQGDSEHVTRLWPFVPVETIVREMATRIAYREDRKAKLDLLAD